MVEIIDYNIYTTPFKELPCLEDAIQKSYSTDDEQNKTVGQTVREYPACISYGIESLIYEGHSNYFSVIERHAVYYAVSLLQNKVKEIADKCREVNVKCSTLESSIYLDRKLYNEKGLQFLTYTKIDMINISLPMWCKEWIQSNRRYLNMSSGALTVYLIIVALNRSTIHNRAIKDEIDKEAKWFLGYIDERLKIINSTSL